MARISSLSTRDITYWTEPAGNENKRWTLQNRTFDELKVGETASLARTLTYKDIELFAIMSGDVNPAHADEVFAKSDMFHKIVAHGMWGGALISTVLGTLMPGPGTIYLNQSLVLVALWASAIPLPSH